jgi:AAA ATPase domain
VLLVGKAGIGKTRLANEFVAWTRAQGAEVLSGHAVELRGRLPYQPLVEAFRPRLEEENAPEDLLDDLWLAELSRLLPELRVRYPDLPAPTQDELTARLRLSEAVRRDELELNPPLSARLLDLRHTSFLRPSSWKGSLGGGMEGRCVNESLPRSSQAGRPCAGAGGEALGAGQLAVCAHRGTAAVPARDAQAVPGAGVAGASFRGGWNWWWRWLPSLRRSGRARSVAAISACDDPGMPLQAHPASATAGDGQRCVGEPGERAASVAGGRAGSAGRHRSAGGSRQEWDAARGGSRRTRGRLGGYGFTHELMREVVYSELGAARRQVLHQRALARLQVEGVKISQLASQVVSA